MQSLFSLFTAGRTAMVQSGAGLRHFSVFPVSENPFKHWGNQLSCTQNHNVFYKLLKIKNLIVLLFLCAVFIQVFHDF